MFFTSNYFGNHQIHAFIQFSIDHISYYFQKLSGFLLRKRIAIPVLVDPVVQYVQKRTDWFLKTLETSYDSNSNIEPIIYNKTDFFSYLSDPKNVLEKTWKTRILIENTPRGNVYMYYDIFKQGFAYYSDQSGIPYKILNAIAMRYCVVFRCLDFFIDENVVPKHKLSPLIRVFIDDDEDEKNKKRLKMEGLNINFKNAPFAKFKSYSHTTANATRPIQLQPTIRMSFWYRVSRWIQLFKTRILGLNNSGLRPSLFSSAAPQIITKEHKDIELGIPEEKKDKIINKFINMGYTQNFSPLIVPIKIKSVIGGSSTRYDSMFSQVQQISYKDFKNLSL